MSPNTQSLPTIHPSRPPQAGRPHKRAPRRLAGIRRQMSELPSLPTLPNLPQLPPAVVPDPRAVRSFGRDVAVNLLANLGAATLAYLLAVMSGAAPYGRLAQWACLAMAGTGILIAARALWRRAWWWAAGGLVLLAAGVVIMLYHGI